MDECRPEHPPRPGPVVARFPGSGSAACAERHAARRGNQGLEALVGQLEGFRGADRGVDARAGNVLFKGERPAGAVRDLQVRGAEGQRQVRGQQGLEP
ncbi:MAG TPA: hypothetical protein PK154_04830, partial [Methanoregulaceae archaeon]|nr:hypothetical protein [Methanoregulaceae archaeon]